ncbi:MAG: type II toxin-antitoxin system RelE/ParE family toxin [Candidatus Woesearchaeota archaeon]|jgi:mRNA-degrading endonuclease RelE of RelBE toxin-antitoxin system|nr:type II toxin-antitoxin system RelE/ParE family toxin [Candidatus Woesearchaeota archaeon]MDP7506677.1 type II toxin-antitoxin system RelE/ParE family toxin [Candidatus Woesearchaeota archaeon]MDP7610187.1 type II toxin-antitoxin system RelE/ParE family toxin [Candidatus Woesearchaeota archaeon]|tara:strand:- start:96 stop:338 length:243 start_codon:yes stop_codon:yes gene_type:complete
MVEVIFESYFKRNFKKIKNKLLKEKIIIQVSKIKDNPEIGKPMQYGRKGTRELYISPFRLSYRIESDIVYILDLYHKDEQ